MSKRELIFYFQRKAQLLGRLLSCVPDGMGRDDPGPWLERAFWLSRLHKHLCKTLTYERAFEFVNKQLMEKRLTEIDADLYDSMVDAGEKPLLARQYRKREYSNSSQFLYHLAIYREYHDPELDYAQTKFYESPTQSLDWFSRLSM